MPDREKVIKGLETCGISGTREDCEGYGCPYFVYNDEVSDECIVHLFEDAIALLKAQEPVMVQKKPMEMVGLQTWDWACGNCGQTVLFSAKFCPWCGRAVKWE